jgi:hypothetical protein
MILKIKAFIYRFCNIFGLCVYLARKEEDAFMKTQEIDSELPEGCIIGLWQARNGFTTVWTYKQGLIKGTISKIKHAFDFRSFNDD